MEPKQLPRTIGQDTKNPLGALGPRKPLDTSQRPIHREPVDIFFTV